MYIYYLVKICLCCNYVSVLPPIYHLLLNHNLTKIRIHTYYIIMKTSFLYISGASAVEMHQMAKEAAQASLDLYGQTLTHTSVQRHGCSKNIIFRNSVYIYIFVQFLFLSNIVFQVSDDLMANFPTHDHDEFKNILTNDGFVQGYNKE